MRSLAVRRSGWLLGVATLMVTAVASLAGCSESAGVTVPTAGTTDMPTSPPSNGSQNPPASLSSPATSEASSGSGSASASSAAAVLCRTADLAVSVGRVDAGAGQRYVPVVFRNTGTRACVLKGYPGVAGLDAAGAQAAQARREAGLTAARVTLAPGASASAVVHAGAIPSGGATCPPDYVALLVTPPDETHSVRVVVTLPACAGLTVRPVVAGAGR